jgi:hypothetical protein
MRSSISAQSCASRPPAPGWISTIVAHVVLAAEELLQLEVVERRGHHRDLRLQLGERLGVALLGQLEEHLRLVDALALRPPPVDRGGDARVLARDVLCALGIVPEVG